MVAGFDALGIEVTIVGLWVAAFAGCRGCSRVVLSSGKERGAMMVGILAS